VAGDSIEPRRPTWSDVLRQGCIAFVGTAAFPRLAHRLRWPTRVGPRGFAAYVAFNTLVLFAVRTWIFPVLKRMAADRDPTRDELREQLRREPSNGVLNPLTPPHHT
jgi:hypothetical protein